MRTVSTTSFLLIWPNVDLVTPAKGWAAAHGLLQMCSHPGCNAAWFPERGTKGGEVTAAEHRDVVSRRLAEAQRRVAELQRAGAATPAHDALAAVFCLVVKGRGLWGRVTV
eukprot:SAG22_NODE_11127_length_499_cov_0.972500_1_plen_111_part_10